MKLGLICSLLALSIGCGAAESEDGVDGINGQDGEKGEDGNDGRNGKDGRDGRSGSDGADGLDGQDGSHGMDGTDGQDGQDGKDLVDLSRIELDGERVYPEGIALDDQGGLFLGSFANGTIYHVAPGTNDALPWVNGITTNAAGMQVRDGVLWVCDNFLTSAFSDDAAIVGIALDTQEEVARHEVGEGPEICNDLTFDNAGNLYATLSFSNSVVQVKKDELLGQSAAILWENDELLRADYEEGNFGLNGIAFDGNSTIYVASHFAGHLFAITMDEEALAADTQIVELLDGSGEPTKLGFPDGLEFEAQGTLMVAEQQFDWLARIDIQTGKVSPVAGGLDNPSTFAFDEEGDAWVVNSQLNDFAQGTAPILPFDVLEIPLD